MAKYKKLVRNIEVKKTPRLFRPSGIKMVEKIKPNGKKQYRRKYEKQKLFKKQDS